MPDRMIEAGVFGGFAALCGLSLAFLLLKTFKVKRPYEHKLFLPLLAAGMLVAYFSRAVFSAEDDPEKAKFMECLATHNQVIGHYKTQSKENKFEFTAQVLEHSYGKEKADEYISQREQALSNEDAMDSFFEAVLSENTEACVSNVSKGG
jgi:hypothetical protein